MVENIFVYNIQATENAKTFTRKEMLLEMLLLRNYYLQTGMRISELCSLKINDVNLYDGTISIYGKGDKERRIQIGNESVD